MSGLTVRFRRAALPGGRVVEARLDSGDPVVPEGRYRVVVNNFLAEGGDGLAVLTEGTEVERTGIVDLDALIEYLGRLSSPTPVPSVGRLIAID